MTDDKPSWVDVAAYNELFEGAGIAAPVAGREVALFLQDGVVYATDILCTHGDARLCDGFLEGHEIECPYHQGRFDIRTGAATGAPCTEPIRTWPVKVEEGRVWLRLPD
ncbi:MAG: non-heme iron oxygenase ferredoxin subunit [Hylemonella sp.]